MLSLKPIVMGTFSLIGTPARVFGLASATSSLEVVGSSGTSFLVMDVVRILTLELGEADRRLASPSGALSSASSSAPGALSVRKPRAANCVSVPGP